jgi:SPP1 family predicted phage head-tail adaptor
MRAGQLRHTIAIQQRTQTTDNMGGYTEAWAAVTGMSAVPAAVWPLKSSERLEEAKLELSTTYRIRIRYRPGVDASMRIYWSDKSKTFNIISITNLDERNRVIEFLAKEEI